MADGNNTAQRRRTRRTPPITTPDPIEIAMEAQASGKTPAGVAARLLAKQERLVGWQIASERAAFALKVLTGLAGAAVAFALAVMVWQASEANGLVVEAFLVPPSLAAKGATGEVVARDVLDRLGEIDAEAQSVEAVRVSDAWSQGAKVQLLQSGLSLDDLQRLLRRWLGRETYVSGEVVQTARGVRLKARAGAGRAVVAEGPAEDLPALTARAAEGLFGQARPLPYAEVLIRRRDYAAAKPLLARVLAHATDERQEAYAHYLQGVIAYREGRPVEAIRLYELAARSPDRMRAAMALSSRRDVEGDLGHQEAAIRYTREAVEKLTGARGPVERLRLAQYRSNMLADSADYAAAAEARRPLLGREALLLGRFGNNSGGIEGPYASYLAYLHRPTEGRNIAPPGPAFEIGAENWAGVVAIYERPDPEGAPAVVLAAPRNVAAHAMALAHLGRVAEARVVASSLPSDCAFCLAAKGVILSVEGDGAGSDRMFAEAVRQAPSWPFGRVWWARERLRQGRANAAIDVAQPAAKLFPRFADPVEQWGEALLMKGDTRGATAKFAAAAKLTPRWGRLHLKWGEALAAQGKAAEARAKWRAAAGMDLTMEERARVNALLQQRTT
jgi:tetratricopeptide (TPR) repeat protein